MSGAGAMEDLRASARSPISVFHLGARSGFRARSGEDGLVQRRPVIYNIFDQTPGDEAVFVV